MTKQELQKEYNELWKAENPTKYVVWLVCYIGDLIPLVVALLQLMDGELNDKKVSTMVICLAVMFVLGIISMVISCDRNKGWKKYLEENRDRLK